MRRLLGRWAVPGLAIASMAVPAVLGLAFPQLGGYGGFSMFGDCDCYDCIEWLEGRPPPPASGLPEQPQEPAGTLGIPAAPEEEVDPSELGERPQPGGKVPEAVTRPRIDPHVGPDTGSYPKSPPRSRY